MSIGIHRGLWEFGFRHRNQSPHSYCNASFLGTIPGLRCFERLFFSFPIELANANGQHDLGHFQVEGREAPERHPGLRCIAGRMQSKDVTTNPVARCYNVT